MAQPEKSETSARPTGYMVGKSNVRREKAAVAGYVDRFSEQCPMQHQEAYGEYTA